MTVPSIWIAAAPDHSMAAGLDRAEQRADFAHAARRRDLFERVSNAPKLLGDQFLARVYRLAALRFHVGEWNGGILRKLETLEDFYEQLHGKAAGRRLELLEWIIIILIFVEIVLPLLVKRFPMLY